MSTQVTGCGPKESIYPFDTLNCDRTNMTNAAKNIKTKTQDVSLKVSENKIIEVSAKAHALIEFLGGYAYGDYVKLTVTITQNGTQVASVQKQSDTIQGDTAKTVDEWVEVGTTISANAGDTIGINIQRLANGTNGYGASAVYYTVSNACAKIELG